MSLSREDMLNELCHIVSVRNHIQKRRQLARSKKNYYEHILQCIERVRAGSISPYHLNGIPKKYLKSPKSQLKMLIKTHQGEQLLAEAELHGLTFKTHKRVIKLLKELNYRQIPTPGDNMITGLYPKEAHVEGGCDCHPSIKGEDLISRSEEFLFDTMILRNMEVDF